MNEGAFGTTSYYFRLGPIVKVVSNTGARIVDLSDQPSKSIFIDPDGYAIVQSLETFDCADKVFALFGQATDFALRGFTLNHAC